MIIKRLGLGIGLVGWAGTVACAMYFVEYRESKPGELAPVGSAWPRASKIKLNEGKATLLFFAHPKCPCTRASLEELDRLISTHRNHPKLVVIFENPQASDPTWAKTDLWDHAKRIPGTEVVEDDMGVECRRFSAFTSGTTILFSRSGQELFRGGLTTGRGHEGQSIGGDALATYCESGTIPIHSAPVFGCALLPQRSEDGK